MVLILKFKYSCNILNFGHTMVACAMSAFELLKRMQSKWPSSMLLFCHHHNHHHCTHALRYEHLEICQQAVNCRTKFRLLRIVTFKTILGSSAPIDNLAIY